MAHRYRLERVQLIPRARVETFAFFEDAANLERITPPFLNFRVTTSGPLVMREGLELEYRLRLHGVPLLWRSRIERYEPGHCFVDTQLRGPYRYWHHLHEFTDAPGGTQMRDVVDYELPFGPLGRIAHGALVRSQLERIFDYRYEAVAKALSGA
jgi:ligand-binding SRPBCC domain-containing protein